MADPLRSVKMSIINNAKGRARRKGVAFAITIDDVDIPDVCPIFGMKLKKNKGFSQDNSPTLDRIRPDLGYVPGNVVVLSHLANTIKSTATSADLYMVADWLHEQEKRFK